MKHILLAADGSAHALNAAKQVVKLGQGFPKIQVTVISVIDAQQSKTAALDLKVDKDSLHLKHVKKIEATLHLLDDASIDYQVEILHGDPGSVIIKQASVRSIDLLVLGSRGLNSLKEVLLGSVSHKVIKQVACPVLVVK